MPKNFGLDLNDNRGSKDWILGGISGMAKDILQPDRNWLPFLPVYEPQSFPWGDTMSCVTFSAWNAVETMAKRRHGMDLNKSDRFTAKLSGTTATGNNFWNVAESITRLHGAVEQASWPNGDAASFADFFKEIPQLVIDEGNKWLAGEYVIQREYVPDDIASLWEALQYGPIQVAIHAYGPLVNDVYQRTEDQGNHAVLLYSAVDGQYFEIYDHYTNLYKKLAWNTRFWGAMRFDIRKKSELQPAPAPTPVYQFVENHRYFLAAAGGRTLLFAGGKLRLDNLAKILDQWLGRNDGNVIGKNHTITLNELTGVQLYNLKGDPVTLNDNFGNTPMSKILEFLKGKKTYVIFALGLLVFALKIGGIIDEKVAIDILTALGLGGLFTIRLALAGK